MFPGHKHFFQDNYLLPKEQALKRIYVPKACSFFSSISIRLIKYITCTAHIFLHRGAAYLLTRTNISSCLWNSMQWMIDELTDEEHSFKGWQTSKWLWSAALSENIHVALRQIKTIKNSRLAATKKIQSQLFPITHWNNFICHPTKQQQDSSEYNW